MPKITVNESFKIPDDWIVKQITRRSDWPEIKKIKYEYNSLIPINNNFLSNTGKGIVIGIAVLGIWELIARKIKCQYKPSNFIKSVFSLFRRKGCSNTLIIQRP